MNTRAGEPTSAVYGFSVLLLKLLRERRPEGVAFARDLGKPTFRHERYDAYKAGRAPMPDLLRPQWRRLDQLLAALGVPVHAAPGFEADDVLATLSARLSGKLTVVSGDRDLFQLVGPDVEVLFLGARGQKPEAIDEAAVRARYGVSPKQMPSLMALIGEVADNLPGVPGVGVKTAAKLVTQYGAIGPLVADLPSVPGKLGVALREAAESIVRNEALATLRTDVPLAEPLVSPITPEARERLRALFEELEFKSLASRIHALA